MGRGMTYVGIIRENARECTCAGARCRCGAQSLPIIGYRWRTMRDDGEIRSGEAKTHGAAKKAAQAALA